ncbi:hypothetical protein FS842_001362 [Serendipita sp. 407]|nr:hypothetical protein FS842_001362 [Serendipita sp. 407]
MHQVPTARGIKIRSAADAHLIFYAVHLGRLPMISRRLDTKEREEVVSGAVFVWEERSATTSNGSPPKLTGGSGSDVDANGSPTVISGIERWTDGLKWGPSRVRDDFLFYQEKDSNEKESVISPPPVLVPGGANTLFRNPSRPSGRLIKQTYSVHYYPQILEGRPPTEPARKWHLTAYHSAASVDHLADVSSVPELQSITPPDGLFKKARVGKKVPTSASSSQINVPAPARNGINGVRSPTLGPSESQSILLSSPPAPYPALDGPKSLGYGEPASVATNGIVDPYGPPATNGQGSSHFQPRTPSTSSIRDSSHFVYSSAPPPPQSMAPNHHYGYSGHRSQSSFGGDSHPSFPPQSSHIPPPQSNDPHSYPHRQQPGYPTPSLPPHYPYPPQATSSQLSSHQPPSNGYDYSYPRAAEESPTSTSAMNGASSHPNGQPMHNNGSPYSVNGATHSTSYDTYHAHPYHTPHPSGSQTSTAMASSPRQRHSIPTLYGYTNGEGSNPHLRQNHGRSGSYSYALVTGAGGAMQHTPSPAYMTPPTTYVPNPSQTTYMAPSAQQAQPTAYGTPTMMAANPIGTTNTSPPVASTSANGMSTPQLGSSGIRSPPSGVIRSKRAARRSDEGAQPPPHHHRPDESTHGSPFGHYTRPSGSSGDAKAERGIHFSPYERPPTVHRARQHPHPHPHPASASASASSQAADGAAGTSNGETNGGGGGGGHFVPLHPHPHQQPGPPPISAHSRRGSYPHYPPQAVPPYGGPPPVPPLPPQPGMPPTQQTGPVYHFTNGGPPSGTSRGSISTGIGESSPTTYGSFDYTAGTSGAGSGASHTWTNPALSSSHGHEQTHGNASQSFQYGGEYPTENPPPDTIPFQGHAMIPPVGTSEATGSVHYGENMSLTAEGSGNRGGGPDSANQYPSHMAPHPNPNSSPPMLAFRPRSGTFPEEQSFGGTEPGTVTGPPVNGHSLEETSGDDGAYASRAKSAGRASAQAPPKLDIALATAAVMGSSSNRPPQTSASASRSGSLSSTTASKLGPLTPSLSVPHHTRDPEDERVLDLLSRSTPSTAVGPTPVVVGGNAVIASSASASGSVHGGSIRGGSVGSVVTLGSGKRPSLDGEITLIAPIVGD